MVLLPLQSHSNRTCAYQAGIYFTHATFTNFAAAKAAIISIARQFQHIVSCVLLQESVLEEIRREATKVLMDLVSLMSAPE
jgi:hypothetical protein